MARRNPPRKVTYFEPVAPRLARNTIIESTFEVGRRFRCTMRIDRGQLDPGAVIRPEPGEWRACPSASTRSPAQSAPESHLFRTGRAAPRAQHDHRIHLRGRPPFPPHDAHRPRPARSRRGDPAGTLRMARMSERLDEEELADWRAGRNAVYQLAALTVGARLAVADA
jgi:hypothetical protein